MKNKVTIAGSYRKHFDRILAAKQTFEDLGVDVLRPENEQISSYDEELVRLEGDPADLAALQEKQLEAIRNCDLLFVVNPGGYLGASATLEVGYAHRQGVPIITSEEPFEAAVATLIKTVGQPVDALTCLEN